MIVLGMKRGAATWLSRSRSPSSRAGSARSETPACSAMTSIHSTSSWTVGAFQRRLTRKRAASTRAPRSSPARWYRVVRIQRAPARGGMTSAATRCASRAPAAGVLSSSTAPPASPSRGRAPSGRASTRRRPLTRQMPASPSLASGCATRSPSTLRWPPSRRSTFRCWRSVPLPNWCGRALPRRWMKWPTPVLASSSPATTPGAR
jgi:hypothetical protein